MAGWFRWSVRILAFLIILFGIWILLLQAPVNTAGNAASWLIGGLESSALHGPEAAFERLCMAEQTRIGNREFTDANGEPNTRC